MSFTFNLSSYVKPIFFSMRPCYVNSIDALCGFDLFWIIVAEAMLKRLNRVFKSPENKFSIK